jgi:hypothetical protein
MPSALGAGDGRLVGVGGTVPSGSESAVSALGVLGLGAEFDRRASGSAINPSRDLFGE